MNIEKEVVISVLKLTKEEDIDLEIVSKDSKIPLSSARFLIEKLNKEGFLELHNKNITVNRMNRLKLATYALKLGTDLERVTRFLDWKEFEKITAIAFERNGYQVKENLRFEQGEGGGKWI